MRSPAFPPRRPSHLIRYIFPALLLLCLFYYLSKSDDRVAVLVNHPEAGHGSAAANQPRPDARLPRPDVRPIHKEPPVPPLSPPLEPQPPQQPQQPIPPHDVIGGALGSKAGASKPIKETEKKPVKGTDKKPEKQKEKPIGQAKTSSEPPVAEALGNHPIDDLIRRAEDNFDKVLAKEVHTLAEAAEAYRMRRGRHPPPGFDKWFEFAEERDSVIVEDFFDQIYHDLGPFWGLEPRRIRKEAWDYEMTINVRNGNASAQSDWFWTQIWLDMFKTIEHLLPDMDIALNAMDEPRLVVPWEHISTYMQRAEKNRAMPPAQHVISDFQQLPLPGKGDRRPATRKKYWENTEPYWLVARRGCPPDSPARTMPVVQSLDELPSFSSGWATPHQYQGYVSNYTLSTEFCHQPDLQGQEGIFIRPLSTSATQVLFPMFGGSKLATNNEILLPAPMYWNEEERFTGGGFTGPKWSRKYGPLIWRGVATGGRNNESNWKGFQRHRFVSMNNGTKLLRAEGALEAPINFELPDPVYGLSAQREGRLGEWVSEWADVGFTDLMCDPSIELEQEWGHCIYTDEQYDLVLGQAMAFQFEYKYLPDVDGNSFSGRYLGFLRSTSLPIKSTLWREWHDSRLFPWKHFVPMDNRFGDYYGIMEYFLGYGDSVPGHDAAAERIATAGKDWAEKVLRKEDMQVYVLRLLLEYARLSDDRRERMGFVGDLAR
ncbi:glycosyltransferase family 90 protein [Xylariaceae sp. FL0804]|nr:glycosyltransferase family 90 protein [Xylariaceae sp. FL0804]